MEAERLHELCELLGGKLEAACEELKVDGRDFAMMLIVTSPPTGHTSTMISDPCVAAAAVMFGVAVELAEQFGVDESTLSGITADGRAAGRDLN